MPKSEKLIVYTDGGSRGNPGPAALGVVISDEKGRVIKECGEKIGIKTNNEAEYAAVIFALKKIKALFGKEKTKKMEVNFKMDSEFVMRQLNGEYKVEEEKLFPLFIFVWNLKMDFAKVTFSHVRREQNKAADRLVNMALDSEQGKLWQ
ncbi:MAG: ribonuclease HI family protein [Candidatus Giovannonibacteria bacterium]|nr:MAG: ribonuclease HI family protein [Candidatus Giovannonibacteria bacterium]